MKERLDKLLSVKSLVTIALTQERRLFMRQATISVATTFATNAATRLNHILTITQLRL